MEQNIEPRVLKDVVVDIEALTHQMENFHLSTPQYRTAYVRMALLYLDYCRLFNEPEVPKPRSFWGAARLDTIRVIPPHIASGPTKISNGQGACYGCGNNGHQMIECPKVKALINQRFIMRVQGKIRWENGERIVWELEETWVNAIR